MRTFKPHEIHLWDYLYVLRKRKFILFVFFTVVVSSALVYTLFEDVLYRSSVTILIERENPNVVDFKEVMALDASTTDYYQTQYQILKSNSLIHALIQEERLDEDDYFKKIRRSRLRSLLEGQELSSKWLSEFMVEQKPEDTFIRKMLKIAPVRNSRLVEVSVMHPNPEKAAKIANHLVELFIRRSLEDRFAISKRASDLISGQVIELKDKVKEAEEKLQKYKEKNNLVSIPSLHEENQFLKDAKIELIKIQSEEAKLAQRYLPAHPKRIHIRSQIEAVEGKIAEEEKRLLDFSRIAVTYEQLEREANSSRQIYESLLSRMQETSSESKTQASNVTVVDPAEPSPKPFKPRPFLNLLAAIFIGFSGGVCLAFFIEYLDSTVKVPDDIEKGLAMDLLGVIPRVEGSIFNQAKNGKLFLNATRHTPASEAIRALRTALLFRLRQAEGSRVILITSPNPEEGKSSIASNLAAAFEQNHLRVVLIDADLRRPKLHKVLGTPHQNGLTDILEGQSIFENAVRTNVSELGFDFVSCGAMSNHPTELLGSDNMKKLIEHLRVIYDIILIDSPPYLAVADVVVLSEYAQALVVVARYQKTDRRHLKDLKKRFNYSPAKVLGVVINQVGVKERDYYYHQYYYYGYGDAARK